MAGDFCFIFIFHSPADGSLMSTVASGGFSFTLDSSTAWLRWLVRALFFPIDQRLDAVGRALCDFFLVSSAVVLPWIFIGVYDLSHTMAQA
jgi:hypothetical protein